MTTRVGFFDWEEQIDRLHATYEFNGDANALCDFFTEFVRADDELNQRHIYLVTQEDIDSPSNRGAYRNDERDLSAQPIAAVLPDDYKEATLYILREDRYID